MVNITSVTIAKNEEALIAKTLKSLKWCDELLVIDDDSTDNTAKIAESLGAKVYKRALNGDFAAQHNFALGLASNKWVLFVDADEVVSPSLADEIMASPGNDIDGYFLRRTDIWHDRELKGKKWSNACVLRLARKDSGKFKRRVHEYWEINGKTAVLKYPLYHYPHQSVTEFVDQVRFHASLHAGCNKEEGKRYANVKMILWPPLKLIWYFLGQGGYKDGSRGFIYSAMMSFHSFLSWSIIWLGKK